MVDKKWLEKYAAIEDNYPTISVGGLAVELGLYVNPKNIVNFVTHPKFVRLVKHDNGYCAYWLGGLARGGTAANACDKALMELAKKN